MHVVAQRRLRIDGLDNVAGKVARMRGGKPNTANPLHLADCGEQLREAHLSGRIFVGIYILPE